MEFLRLPLASNYSHLFSYFERPTAGDRRGRQTSRQGSRERRVMELVEDEQKEAEVAIEIDAGNMGACDV